MLGETDENWQKNIDTLVEMKPEAVTIYQMEVPYNTTIYKHMKESGALEAPVADWGTKRRWVTDAYAALEGAGYTVTSAYTAVRDPDAIKFVYRDALWSGADMLADWGLVVRLPQRPTADGGGLHYQNQHDIVPYTSSVTAGDSAGLPRPADRRGRKPHPRVGVADEDRPDQPAAVYREVRRRPVREVGRRPPGLRR